MVAEQAEGAREKSQAVAESQETAASAPPADAACTAEKAAPTEPDFIEVWRPGGRRDEHPRHPAGRAPSARRAAPAATRGRAPRSQPLAATPRGQRRAGGCRRRPSPRVPRGGRPERRDRRDRDRADRPDRDDAAASSAASARNVRSAPSGRHAVIARRGAIVRRARIVPSRDPDLRAKYIKGKGESRRDRAPDPNSPFAKLAALKEQLEIERQGTALSSGVEAPAIWTASA